MNVHAGASQQLGIWVRSIGVRSATNVSLCIQGPRGWAWKWKLPKVEELPPRQEVRIELTVTPLHDTGVGDFILNLTVEGMPGGDDDQESNGLRG